MYSKTKARHVPCFCDSLVAAESRSSDPSSSTQQMEQTNNLICPGKTSLFFCWTAEARRESLQEDCVTQLHQQYAIGLTSSF
mmetsp:Transcript_5874/g.11786  ORF Transcript_5874/g.11786 Transcript_5874/m.11786 type:complete len:82 (+) Transcript_5874:1389-1634(+)